MTDNDNQEDDVTKPKLVAGTDGPKPPEDDDNIETAIAKLAEGLGQVDVARDGANRNGIEYQNKAAQLKIEMEERVNEIDKAIAIEVDYIAKAEQGVADLRALVAKHDGNLTLLRIERQARLNSLHELRSKGV